MKSPFFRKKLELCGILIEQRNLMKLEGLEKKH